MIKKLSAIIFLSALAIISLWTGGCKKSSGGGTTALALTIPPGFPAPAYSFADNPLTVQGFALGRKLFYDGRLSKDGNFPCSSCHQQFSAFCTYDHDFSHGYNNQFSRRNAPGLFNMAWHPAFGWDGSTTHLENQALAHITAPNEMAEDISNVVTKLKADPDYPNLFRAAFGDDQVTSQRILKALAQFSGSLVSYNSKYDRVKRGEDSFTPQEQSGYLSFQAKCALCHKEPLFTDFSYRNIGLPLNILQPDSGRMRITGLSADSLKFKVPSLRNCELTFPYMHDGRFYTFDQVLNHYSSGITPGPTLDPMLNGGIPLDNTEKLNLKYFLKTLTDSVLLKDTRYSQP
jgi:cytochrome c peroxidase